MRAPARLALRAPHQLQRHQLGMPSPTVAAAPSCRSTRCLLCSSSSERARCRRPGRRLQLPLPRTLAAPMLTQAPTVCWLLAGAAQCVFGRRGQRGARRSTDAWGATLPTFCAWRRLGPASRPQVGVGVVGGWRQGMWRYVGMATAVCVQCSMLPLPPQLLPASPAGDFEGQVRVWHLPSGACLASFSCGGAQFERAVHKLCWLLAANAEGGAWAGTGTGAAAAPLLVACSEDRGVQFWRVELPPASGSAAGEAAAGPQRGAADTEEQQAPAAACTLVARISVAHRPQDCITAMCPGNAGGSAQQLWTGDSGGHVALWDVSNLTQASTSAAASPAGSTAALGGGLALPQRLLMWRAADAPVVSLDPLAPGHGLLLVGGQDAHMGVWTQRGGLVGRFGQHSWDLDAPATWQDPGALSPPLPLPIDAGGSGLTPQEVISNHRRSSWAARSGSASSAQVSARREGRQPAVGQPAWGEAALEPLAATLASISRLPQTVADDGAANVGATAFQQGTAQPPAVPAASASAHQQLLSPESAGARLSALAAEKVAARASRWEVPVHVQAHSALALQRMDAVPAGTGACRGGWWRWMGLAGKGAAAPQTTTASP